MSIQLSMPRISIMGPKLCPDFYMYKIESNMKFLVFQHFSQPPYAAIANAIQSCKAPDPQNGTQTQARNKQSAPWGNGATLCKNLFDDSIREGVSYPLHTNAPATQTTPAPSAVPISALALAPHPNLQAV